MKFNFKDLEAFLGYNDKDIDNISYHKGGYEILNSDIMQLQEQVTPQIEQNKAQKVSKSREDFLSTDETSHLLRSKSFSLNSRDNVYTRSGMMALAFNGLNTKNSFSKKVYLSDIN
jgi:hypothetical protein